MADFKNGHSCATEVEHFVTDALEYWQGQGRWTRVKSVRPLLHFPSSLVLAFPGYSTISREEVFAFSAALEVKQKPEKTTAFWVPRKRWFCNSHAEPMYGALQFLSSFCERLADRGNLL
jgi:hypothetical protein